MKRVERIQKDPSEPACPYIYRAEPSNFGFLPKLDVREQASSGKGMSTAEARASALGEAVERYSGARWDPGELEYARRCELAGETLDPARLVLYRPEQYADLPYAPYSEESAIGWVRARSLVSGAEVWVPAQAVFMTYTPRSVEEYLFPITSNGLAAGPTLLDAVLRATLEVLERDAFLLTWLDRLPPRRLSPWNHPDGDVVGLCEAYRRRQVEVQLYALPVDHPCHVLAAVSVQRSATSGPAVVVGLGADLDLARAARLAILETAQVRAGLRFRMRRPELRRRIEELVADPQRVTTLDDHDLLYASPQAAGAFEFLFRASAEPAEWEPADPQNSTGKLERLLTHLAGQGRDLIYYNVTPPDMEALGLYTARVIVPDFQPIHFGWKERRLGGTRLYEFPQRMGLADRLLTPADLNPDPHPLA